MIDVNFNAYVFSEQESHLKRNMSEFQDGLERIGLGDYFKVYSNNICFSLDSTIYTFYISESSIFYNRNSRITYSVGALFINAANVMRENMQSKPLENGNTLHVLPKFNSLMDKFREYARQYEKPTVELLKTYYQDLLSVGFCDINAALIIWDFLNFFISDNDILEKELFGKKYNLLYASLFHSLDAFNNFDLFPCEDNQSESINMLAPAVLETQISIQNGIPLLLYTNICTKALFTFDKFQLIKNNYNIRTCEVCSRYYINTDNKNYHSKVCYNCRHLSQRKRKANDEFYLAYDRAYKAMNNRLRYLPQDEKFRKKYKEKYFKPCMKEIEENLSYYKEKNDLSGFGQFIKKTMKKYKVKKE